GGDGSTLQVRQISFRGIKLAATPIDLPMFDMTATFGRNGALQKARMTDGKMTVDLTPKDDGVTLAIQGREWQPPVGPRLQFSELSVSAQADAQQATLTAIEGRIAGGRVKGAAKVNWGSGLRVEGEFSIENARLQELITAYTREFSASGSLKARGSFVLQGNSLKTLFDSSETEANFTLNSGELGNVDLVRAMQSPDPGGTRGGKTKFDSLSGTFSASTRRYAYRQLQLASGPLNASGAFGVAADGSLSGRLNAELGSKGLVVARSSLNITGAVRDPVLRP
ncbi:MAG: AsmA-like C-terminal region-containing protein, partial [Betaproteobacteria bacterium]